MSVRYFDHAGWSHTLSQSCSPIGDGQCDGTDPEDGEPCDCMCHHDTFEVVAASESLTVKHVKRMHQLGWALIGRPRLGLPSATYRQERG